MQIGVAGLVFALVQILFSAECKILSICTSEKQVFSCTSGTTSTIVLSRVNVTLVFYNRKILCSCHAGSPGVKIPKTRAWRENTCQKRAPGVKILFSERKDRGVLCWL